MNKAMIIGNLGADPDIRYMPNGDPVTNISVATNKNWTDQESGEKKQRTEWHRCTAFGKRAENLAKYLRKGSKVFIEGELQTRSWEDKEGIKRYTTEIRVFNFEFLDQRNTGERPPHPADAPPDDSGKPQQQRPQTETEGATQPDFDDDIPF